MADETVATNREARHNYHILESFEAGIVLQGSEVKSLRDKKANLKDSFARIDEEEIFIYNMHITPYPQAGRFAPEPKRKRKLLIHKSEIRKIFGRLTQKGLTLVPLKNISRGARLRWKLPWPRARSSMTNARISNAGFGQGVEA
jgi:SsrA-binding protein